MQGAPLDWNGIRHYPADQWDAYGNAIIQAHAEHHFEGGLRDGLVMSLIDVWVLQPQVWRKLNACSWVPIDHAPLPGMIRQFFEGSQAIPLAMSRFGQEQLAEWDPIYLPHGIDTHTLKQYDQGECREALNLPEDAFIVGMVAANKGAPSRKGFAQAFEAFAQLARKRSDAFLYLHTEATGRADGEPLPAMLEAFGVPGDRVRFCNQYRYMSHPAPASELARMYSAFDCLLNPAHGEGFGLTVLEAQSCGVPVIVSDFSAMPEVGAVGWHCETRQAWTYQRSFQRVCDPQDVYAALEDAYSGKARDVTVKAAARAHAEKYDANLVTVEYLLPALKEVERRCREREPVEVAA